ncbi:MAG TPA: hypothetical protein DEG42_05675 [Acholeplasmataceae bacterium]|nr:hypothetical protein [Acholeplasmataceae bacterium]
MVIQDKPHSYLITHLQTGDRYVGIVLKRGKTLFDRFEEHMTRRGALGFIPYLEDGFSNDDFSISLISYYDSRYEAGKDETRLIKSLKPEINNNCGGSYDWVHYKLRGFCWLSFSGLRRKINSTPIQRRIDSLSFTQYENDFDYDGRHNRGGEYVILLNRFGRDHTKILSNDNWKNGRKKYKQRMNKKEFTDAEKLSYSKRDAMVKNIWEGRDETTRKTIAANGLSIMNAKIWACEHCGFITTKGNYGRWHGDKCKHKNKVN